MARRPLEERNIRKIMQSGNGSYSLTIPIEMMHTLAWRKGQKITVEQKGKTIVIKDWKK